MSAMVEFQKDMNDAYYFGVPGIIASGSIWLLAGLVSLLQGPFVGIAALVFGGTLIFPVSVLLCKLLGRSGKHQKDNPLASLAIEGTVWMLLSIPIAVVAGLYKPEWFFPAMLLVIGGRYLTFNTLYGNRVFWLFGASLVVSSSVLVMVDAPVYVGGITGGAIELIFALVVLVQAKSLA